MFEKEADEYAGENWQMIHRYQTNDRLAREQSFKDGAEFGYNKAMNEIGYRIESAYREGVAFGKDKAKEEMQAQIEKMKCCSNCDNWNWKHNKCEKKLKGDCFKHNKWFMRNF